MAVRNRHKHVTVSDLSDEMVTPVSSSHDPIDPETTSIEKVILSLSGGKRKRVERYLNNMESHFRIMVEKAGHIRDNIPNVISRLESLKDNLDKWHKGTNLVIAGGSTVSAVAALFALLFAPATGGASLAVACGIGGCTAAIGGMVADGVKQNSSSNECVNVAKAIEVLCCEAEKAYKEFRHNSELLCAILRDINPNLSGLDENDMYQLSIKFACSRLFRNTSKKESRYISASASAIIKPLQSLNVLSKSSRTTITTVNALIRTVEKTSVNEVGMAKSVGKVALRSPGVGNMGIAVVKHGSSAVSVVNQGSKVVKTTASIKKIWGAVVDAVCDVTITKVTQLRAYISTTTKEFGPLLAKTAVLLTAAGIAFDVYIAYNAFSDLIKDTKCDASRQITNNIDQLREIQEQVAQVFDYLQASEDENIALEN